MTVKNFLVKYITHANKVYRMYGIPPLVTLAQAALESQWGKKAPGNNFFGYTAPSGYDGKRQLLKTIEYHSSPNIKYPVVIKITDVGDKYKYVVKRWFKAYPTATESFSDYAALIKNADRYSPAFEFKNDPEKFFAEIFKAGYATSPEYYNLVLSVMNSLKRYLK